MTRKIILSKGFLALLLTLAAGIAPAGSAPANNEAVARLIAAQRAVGTAPHVELGVHLTLAPGWKTYWRDPGEAGMPPAFDWAGSRNVAGAEIAFPAPTRFETYGAESFGYAGEVVLAVRLALAEPGKPADIRLVLDYAVCKEICLPARAELQLKLPAGAATATPQAALIERFRRRVPQTQGGAFTLGAARLSGAPGSETLVVEATALEAAFAAPDLIAEGPASVRFGRPKLTLSADRRRAQFELPVQAAVAAASAAGAELTVTLIDGGQAIERRLKLGPASD